MLQPLEVDKCCPYIKFNKINSLMQNVTEVICEYTECVFYFNQNKNTSLKSKMLLLGLNV